MNWIQKNVKLTLWYEFKYVYYLKCPIIYTRCSVVSDIMHTLLEGHIKYQFYVVHTLLNCNLWSCFMVLTDRFTVMILCPVAIEWVYVWLMSVYPALVHLQNLCKLPLITSLMLWCGLWQWNQLWLLLGVTFWAFVKYDNYVSLGLLHQYTIPVIWWIRCFTQNKVFHTDD